MGMTANPRCDDGRGGFGGIVHDDARALCRRANGNGCPDARAASDDGRNFSVKPEQRIWHSRTAPLQPSPGPAEAGHEG
jgi:hypothetical protein